MPSARRAEGFPEIDGIWEQLLPLSTAHAFFVTPSWQRLWWQHFGEGWELHLISVHSDDSVVGIAPLARKDGVVEFLGGQDLFDFHDFIVSPSGEDPFYKVVWDYLLSLDWQTIRLNSLPQGSPTLRHIPRLAEASGITVEVVQEDVSPVAALPPTWDGFLAGLTKKDRHELRRKMRRLDGADSTNQYTYSSPADVRQSMQDFFRLLRASSPDKMAFLTPKRESFFLDAALELAARNQFKHFVLEMDGVRVASCICFEYANASLLYNSGYDPSYSALSVGLVNKALCIKQAIEEGKQAFYFLRGNERYKYDLGGKDQAIYQLTAQR